MMRFLAASTWLLLVMGCLAFFAGVTSSTTDDALRGFLAAMMIWGLGGAASLAYDRLEDRRHP